MKFSDNKIKVLIVNTQTEGGAANSCIRLYEGLKSNTSIRTNLIILKTKNHKQYGHNLISNINGKLSFRIRNKWRQILCDLRSLLFDIPRSATLKKIRFLRQSKGLDFYSTPLTPYDITATEGYKRCDIVNLHWVAGLLDYPSFFGKNKKPIVWTLHDMSPLLGGEHYAEWYSGLSQRGEPNLRVFSAEELSLESRLIRYKRGILADTTHLYFICPSQWLMQEVIKSGICNASRVFHVPYGIDTDVFKPMDTLNYRHSLGIGSKSKVLLFVADSLNNQRKGITYLLHALQRFSDEITLLSVGTGELESESLGVTKYISLGRIENERNMAEIYNAANFFVIPSLMDNLPNTVIESLCCGTPVIGFPVGGIRDMINDTNGIIAQYISVDALENAIKIALYSEEKFDRYHISSEAHRTYSQDIQAKSYIEIFEKVMSESTDNSK